MSVSAVDFALFFEIVIALVVMAGVSVALLSKRNKELALTKTRHRQVVANLEALQNQWQSVNGALLDAQKKISVLENQLPEQSFDHKVEGDNHSALRTELKRLKDIEGHFQISKAELLQDKQALERLNSELAEANSNHTEETKALQVSIIQLEEEKQVLIDELQQIQGFAFEGKEISSEFSDGLGQGGMAEHIGDDDKVDITDLREICAKQNYTIKQLTDELEKISSESELVFARGKISTLEGQLSQSAACINMLEEEIDVLRAETKRMPPENDGIQILKSEPPEILKSAFAVESPPDNTPDRCIPIADFKMAVGTCSDFESLADAVLDSIADIGLSASLKIQGQKEAVTKSTAGDVWPDDLEKISGNLSLDDAADSEMELLIRVGRLTLLIKDMPLYDPARCEEIKDSVVAAVEIAAEAADAI